MLTASKFESYAVCFLYPVDETSLYKENGISVFCSLSLIIFQNYMHILPQILYSGWNFAFIFNRYIQKFSVRNPCVCLCHAMWIKIAVLRKAFQVCGFLLEGLTSGSLYKFIICYNSGWYIFPLLKLCMCCGKCLSFKLKPWYSSVGKKLSLWFTVGIKVYRNLFSPKSLLIFLWNCTLISSSSCLGSGLLFDSCVSIHICF